MTWASAPVLPGSWMRGHVSWGLDSPQKVLLLLHLPGESVSVREELGYTCQG